MSEFSEDAGSTERRRFDPVGDVYTSPLEPYNERVIQFSALKQMGYPVELQQLAVDELPNDFFSWQEEWQRDDFPVWVRPQVFEPGFEHFIEDLDVPGDMIRSDDEELDERISDHPVKLIWHVDNADVHMLGYDIDCFEKNELQYLKDSGTGILTRDLLVGCYMTALERYTDWKSRGHVYWRDTSWAAVTVDDYIRHNLYQRLGFRPASPEQLGALAIDYYKLAEQAQPDMLKFKETS